MQRRKFLKLFGIGLSAAAIPTAVAAKAALTPPGEPKTAPQPPSGSRPTATAPSTSTNPCCEILADGTYSQKPLSRYFGSSINTRTITIAEGHHVHTINIESGDIHCIRGPQTYSLPSSEALLDFPVQHRGGWPRASSQMPGHSMPITPSMRQLIDQHARYQTHAMNGDSYWDHEISENMTKTKAGEAWQLLADNAADRIEAEARVLGYTTQWPGLYPEFQPGKRHAPPTSDMQHWHQIAQNALPPIKNGEIQ